MTKPTNNPADAFANPTANAPANLPDNLPQNAPRDPSQDMRLVSALRSTLAAGALLALCALLAVLLLTGTERLTRDRIAAARHAAELAALSIVLPAAHYDNDPLADRVQVLAPRWLGSGDAMTIHRGRRDGTPSALAIEAIAPDGYAGPIRLIVGVDVDGRVLGVRITEHRETPGLGDPIDASRSDWILSFVGRSIGQPPEARWTVRKDGGEFDQFAGATVSPRAVVHAVRRVLLFVTAHGVELQRADAGEELRFVDGPR